MSKAASRVWRVLILCTGNSARSILAEALLRVLGGGRFEALSAGSDPKGRINPNTLPIIRGLGLEPDDFRSKSWDEFAGDGARPIDLVITVCDSAAGEVCPVWPGGPVTVHWGLDDPAAIEGSEATIGAAFAETAAALRRRMELLVALPDAALERLTARAALEEIHQRADQA